MYPPDITPTVGQGQEYGLAPVFKFSLGANLPGGYLQVGHLTDSFYLLLPHSVPPLCHTLLGCLVSVWLPNEDRQFNILQN